MKLSFTVSSDCHFDCDLSWTGLEVYSVNGKEVCRFRSQSLTGEREFKVKVNGKIKTVRLELKFLFKRIMFSNGYVFLVFIDDELFIENLLTKDYIQKTLLGRLMSFLGYLLIALIIILFMVGLFFENILRFLHPS